VQAALAAKKEAVQAKRTEFDQQLEADPDAATRRLAHERFAEEERVAEEEAAQALHEARVSEAFHLASRAIPDFAERAPAILSFGNEMGYSADELRGIADGRDMVTLYLASIAGNMIKAGLMDTKGNLLQQAQPSVQATDPRLKTPAAPQTLSSAPGRTTDAGKSPEQQLLDILNLSPEEFAKIDEDTLLKLTA
jgi:hypothetical protein